MSERQKTILLILILLNLVAWIIYRDQTARHTLSDLRQPSTNEILVS